MLKHIDDNGDLNVLMNSSGAILFICSLCQSMWTGTFTPVPVTTGQLSVAGEMDSLGTTSTLRVALESNPSVLEGMGFDPQFVVERLLD